MRLLDLLRKSTESLEAAGIEDALPDAEMIVFHALRMDRLDAYVNNPLINTSDGAKVRKMIRRRTKGEPAQYITGSVIFLGLNIKVGRGVLIPRPETELLVEEAIKTMKCEELGARGKDEPACAASCVSRLTPHALLSVLDLCTGSGCIALALGAAIPSAEITGVDASARALSYASENAALNRVENVRFLRGDLFAPVEGSNFHVVVSNPPYVRLRDIASLQREIRDWEPLEALAAGESGLDYYERIMGELTGYLIKGGKCYLEIGHDQRDAIRAICGANGFRSVFKRDMGGRDRIAVVSR